MVSISKAYNDIERIKSLNNKIQNEQATRYIKMTAPELLENPQTANREIIKLSNLMQSGIDEQGLIDYLDHLLFRTNPKVYEMKKSQERMNKTRTRLSSASVQERQTHPWYFEIDEKILEKGTPY